MNNFSKVVVVIMVLMLAITPTACTKDAPEINLPLDNQPNEVFLDPPIVESLDYHIGIVTPGYDYSKDEIQGAWALIAQYGRVESGGIIKHVILPDNFAEEKELVISSITGLVDDPLMKAIIVNQAILGTAAGFQKIRDAGRDDILLLAAMYYDYSMIAAMHYEDPNILSQVADVIINSDEVTRGYYDILRAKNMGATTFVFMSFSRHMSIDALFRRRNIYEEACKDLGLEFVFETVPDPSGDLSLPYGPASISRLSFGNMMSRFVEQYGKDTVFSITNTNLEEETIWCVARSGAMFLNQSDISPTCGYPGAFELDFSAEAGDWPAIVKTIEEVVVAKKMGGRMGTWPYSFRYCNTTCLAQFAMEMIEGKGTDTVTNDIISAYQVFTPGCEWLAQVYVDSDTGQEISNYYLMAMDTYILGQGFSGVFSEPFPKKYFSIK
ncbi:MAG: DUF3798 domain-containing protein [Clostridiales bacterium]|jgi:hypothetical protein|nr:DUF3798 domain-containing protein [Clostridiales bacterium]